MSDDEEISVYDEVEIEDMTYDETLQTYHYPCPCGDRFEIALADLQDESNDIAVCPSCSLMIRVIYEVVSVNERTGQQKPAPSLFPGFALCLRWDGHRALWFALRAPSLAPCVTVLVTWVLTILSAQQDNLPKPDEPEPDPEPATDEKPAQVPVAA